MSFSILLLILGIIYHSNVLELISVFFGLASVSLNLKRKRYAFIFYSVYALLYGIVSFINKQFGEAFLNIFYNLPIYIYTSFKLLSNKNNEEKKTDFKIKSLSNKMIIVLILLIPVITIAYGFILKALDSNLPFLNALATAFALISCFLASKGNIFQWFFWIGYSLVLTIIWCINYQSNNSSGLLYLVLNIIYILINLYGLILWKRERVKL